MKILGFDTATAATTVALLDSETGASVERRDDPPPGGRPRHTARLMALIVEAMRIAEVGWPEVDRIAVGVGPGTFTGLRIGVATARGLARAGEIPLVGVSTLHALALNVAAGAQSADEAVVAVIDGRRDEVFAAGWSLADVPESEAEPLFGPAAVPIRDLTGVLLEQPRGWLAGGDGSLAFRSALEHSGARIPRQDSERNLVSAVEHCRLALGLPPGPPEGIRPDYLRLPDAEVSLRAARQ